METLHQFLSDELQSALCHPKCPNLSWMHNRLLKPGSCSTHPFKLSLFSESQNQHAGLSFSSQTQAVLTKNVDVSVSWDDVCLQKFLGLLNNSIIALPSLNFIRKIRPIKEDLWFFSDTPRMLLIYRATLLIYIMVKGKLLDRLIWPSDAPAFCSQGILYHSRMSTPESISLPGFWFHSHVSAIRQLVL